ncbi:MAG: hypothetical protein QOF63_2044 [Thermoanaerobaculia bacterium]|jgi:hypothetical protein|nr:hypothetical protein [Thermoanaerobaculia bacterium]
MRILFTVTLLLSAIPLLAQPFTTSTVEVVLEGCGSGPEVITVVPSNDETRTFEVKRIESNRWRADRSPKKFDARGATASLRLGGARTDCATSREMRDPRNPDRWIAVFTFRCPTQHTWRELTVETKPAVKLIYARELQGSQCVDARLGDDFGITTIHDVAYERESIFVNLGDKLPALRTAYSMAILRGAFGKHALERAPLIVKRTEVIDDLELRNANSGRATPTASGNARTLLALDLPQFDRLTLTVKAK